MFLGKKFSKETKNLLPKDNFTVEGKPVDLEFILSFKKVNIGKLCDKMTN